MAKRAAIVGIAALAAVVAVSILDRETVIEPQDRSSTPLDEASEAGREVIDETWQGAVAENEIISVVSPRPLEEITSPVAVTGEARTFEANVQMRVRDDAGNVLAETFTTARTPDAGVFGPFSASVRYQEPEIPTGAVEVFESSAKDGSEIHRVTIPVRFGAQAFTSVELFFSPREVGDDCARVVSVTRRIPKIPAIGRAALEELLAGPMRRERERFGVTTNIPYGVTLHSLIIRDGAAYADFDAALQGGGSCRVAAIRAQIRETLMRFPVVRDVVISVEGNVEEALQP